MGDSLEPLQILLIAAGLVVAAGGGYLLFRPVPADQGHVRRPYIPFAVIAVGLIIAYRAFAEFSTLDAQDITIMFVFELALAGLLGLQFFVVDRYTPRLDVAGESHKQKETSESDNQWTT
jgi:predicted membrane-bound spermidine synthase